jgi:Domain of unknown function (DUF397)
VDLADPGGGACCGDGLRWRKSRHSNPSGNCVEVAELPDGRVAIRNSRHPAGPILVFARTEVATFLRGIKNGGLGDIAG